VLAIGPCTVATRPPLAKFPPLAQTFGYTIELIKNNLFTHGILQLSLNNKFDQTACTDCKIETLCLHSRVCWSVLISQQTHSFIFMPAFLWGLSRG